MATGIGAVAGVTGYGVAFGRHHLELTSAEAPVSGLPAELHGLRVGVLTDVHHSRMVPADDVARAVARLLAAAPDLIVLGGDYVTWGDRRYVGPVSELLAPLTAPHGVFAVLGNHDDDRDMAAALAARGFTVLKDQRTQVTLRGAALQIAGIRFWTRRAAQIAKIVGASEAPTLLLAHDPRRVEEAAALGVGLAISGHTHGGQVVVPGVGALARRRFPVIAGLARREGTTLFVSRGLGTIYVPVRVNCPPEVAVLTLRPRSAI